MQSAYEDVAVHVRVTFFPYWMAWEDVRLVSEILEVTSAIFLRYSMQGLSVGTSFMEIL